MFLGVDHSNNESADRIIQVSTPTIVNARRIHKASGFPTVVYKSRCVQWHA